MPKALPDAELLVIGVSSPLLVGIYRNGELYEHFESDKKTSEALPSLLHDVRYRFNLESLYYAKGPGSFMAIKVTYVMLKTFAIAMDIPFYAADAFAFNRNTPLKAVGKSFFVKRGDTVEIECNIEAEPLPFRLPKRLDEVTFEADHEPMYVLPAV